MLSKEIKSDADIQTLITCAKYFRSAPRKEITINKNLSRKFEVYNRECALTFTVFICSSVLMEQDFSIGLMYDGFLLFRCNGFHGTTRTGFYTSKHHAHPHSHTLTMEDIQCGRGKRPSFIDDMTGKYVNKNTALLYFFEKCNILGFDEYFKDLRQLSFL